MTTVLGLSVTPTAVGWVLAEGHGADGAILDHRELQLPDGPPHGLPCSHGARTASTAQQVAAEVLRARQAAVAGNHRLHMVGVTWSDEAAAQAALLLEALADAGFDNVVPVRQLDTVKTLAMAVAPVIGYEQAAVCILEREWATVVLVDTHDGQTQTAVTRVRGGYDGLTSWLTGMFDHGTWHPGGVVVIGSQGDVSDLSWQLEQVLPVPVLAQPTVQVAVARGAALAAAQSTDFTVAELLAETEDSVVVAPVRSRRYAGAATTLVAAAVTFVASVSLAVGLQLTPGNNSGPARHAVHKSTPPVAEAVAPVPVPPPGQAVPVATPQPPVQQEPVRLTSGGQVEESAPGGQPGGAVPEPGPATEPLRLSRVFEQIPGSFAEPGRPPE